MIPSQNIVAWGTVVPWADERQVEQDLIISRAIVAIFSDDILRQELRFRGGTALQELESRTAAEMRKAYNALDEVLDVRQQARFRVFEEQIERRKIELLMRARQQNRQNQQGPNAKPPIRRPPGR